jgi:hypothetical protein
MITSAYSDLITDIIIGNLGETNNGLEQLYQAMSGISFKPKYKVGDEIFVRLEDVGSWRIDVPKTKSEGLLLGNDDLLKGQISHINVYHMYPYTVSVSLVGTGSASVTVQSILLEEKSIIYEEWPGD